MTRTIEPSFLFLILRFVPNSRGNKAAANLRPMNPSHPILHVESWLAVPGTAAAGLKFLKFILIYLYSSRATQPWRKLTSGPAYAVWLFTQTGKGTQGETMSINHNEGSSPTTLSQSTLAQLVKAGPANDTYYRLPARLPR